VEAIDDIAEQPRGSTGSVDASDAPKCPCIPAQSACNRIDDR
jgi:hypothetical protein